MEIGFVMAVVCIYIIVMASCYLDVNIERKGTDEL
mgnify:CR=1 FL=1